MKILNHVEIKKYNEDKLKQWWVNKYHRCYHCDQLVQFDETDKNNRNLRFIEHVTGKYIIWRCSYCANICLLSTNRICI
jgi:hypothetical protein